MGDDEQMIGPRYVSAAWQDRLAEHIAGSPVNLVSHADRTQVRAVHIDECLRVAAMLEVEPGTRWLDLGTGGGLPGLVLAAAYPDVQWTLLDARRKKLTQVAAFAEDLALANVSVVHGRAEEIGVQDPHAGSYAGVITRAVASLPQTVALSAPFAPHGQIVAVRGPRAREEVAHLRGAGRDVGLSVDDAVEVDGTMRPTWLIRARLDPTRVDQVEAVRSAMLRSIRGGTP